MPQAASAPLPPVLRPSEPPRRSLAELADVFDAATTSDLSGIEVRGVTLATGDLREGELFVAVQGANRHGAEVADVAISKGAVAVLTDAVGAAALSGAGVPVLVVDDPRARLGAISAWVYGTGADGDLPPILAVTGTNGKTSVTHLMQGILHGLGVVTGLSSTAERHIAGQVVPSRLTTPEASEVHALLALMTEREVGAILLEVSAQALTRHRVDGIRFDVAGFTNLSHDHLDDYGDMATYLEAKLQLFREGRSRRAVVVVDQPEGVEVASRSEIPVVTILTPEIATDPDVPADWRVDLVGETPDGVTFTLTGPAGALTTTVPVIGPHMASNAALAIVMLLEAGFEWRRISDLIGGARIDAHLPGRIQRLSGARGPALYLDFGHSPDAFEKTLSAVRRVTPGSVIMVCGANGDRDTTKRADMGRAAALGSDIVVFTDQHPRSEDPAAIRAALVAGALDADPHAVIHQVTPPEDAIAFAVTLAGEQDAILWAGPGHQHYREIAGVRTPFDAEAAARSALRAGGWPMPD
ncbi:UDP-N-acetylmuramoyl-L-alanyl-D-glutamate--2,6-diaminopimelate ligase [Microbacterium marinum]|uniref:UDP-N-acetylmuramoyl-L-alanyl-D-glutamate--2, 6-diaminopimelate ligase n=1 Tax=Microbacterium marinum TaxID=421115 RepID=A0A7W7BRR4_9MICO|nr:UDP-N-acetylmuramoyl-L-alanyl-D-glutamate--2,6-diaminopimelate ligase [Microbacterium marinum]MBB4666484.1 UDP-N-acetylmuramoyl-L-alanyl-D-glutamate--2,6-diaminopimelate ligase [Microbacterium marinum]